METSLKKTEEVASHLRKMIDRMIKEKKVKLPTEKELSELFHVCRGTIRKATEKFITSGILHKISGSGTYIKSEIIKEGVKKNKIKTIVLVYDILEISDFRYPVIRGVVKAANSRGYDTAITSFDNAMEIFREKFFSMEGKNTAMVSSNFSISHISAIKEFPVKIPYVALNDYLYKDIAEYAVLHKPGCGDGLNYLASIGHKKILIFHDFLSKPYIEEVTNAVKNIKVNGIKLDVAIKECQHDYNRVISELNSVFFESNKTKPTAIFCVDDKIAAWTISHLRNTNIRVPADISVLGVGDLDICESSRPRITTISPDYDFIGEMAIEMVDSQFEGKRINDNILFVDNRLIKRDSCRER